MAFPQSTLSEIIDSEREMVLTARDRFGEHYTNACDCSIFLSKCVVGIEHDRMMFGRFLALMKKHHMLALVSIVRLHKVQAMMNFRQVLEAGSAAAFAIANPEQHHFANVDDNGLLDPTQELTKKRYKWLDENYRDRSNWIKETKERINISTAHANIVSSDSVFRVTSDYERVDAPFFDEEDAYFVNTDLYLISSAALTLVDLFYGVNKDREVITFCDGFSDEVQRLAKKANQLLTELKATDRYKNAVEKFGIVEK